MKRDGKSADGNAARAAAIRPLVRVDGGHRDTARAPPAAEALDGPRHAHTFPQPERAPAAGQAGARLSGGSGASRAGGLVGRGPGAVGWRCADEFRRAPAESGRAGRIQVIERRRDEPLPALSPRPARPATLGAATRRPSRQYPPRPRSTANQRRQRLERPATTTTDRRPVAQPVRQALAEAGTPRAASA